MPDTETIKMRDKPMPSEKSLSNLRPFSKMSASERKQIASRGGKNSAKTRAYNRTFKEAAEWALSLPAIKGNPTVEKIRRQYPGLNNQDALVISVMAEGIAKGDVKALLALRDTVGESPAQKLDLSNSEPMKIVIETVD